MTPIEILRNNPYVQIGLLIITTISMTAAVVTWIDRKHINIILSQHESERIDISRQQRDSMSKLQEDHEKIVAEYKNQIEKPRNEINFHKETINNYRKDIDSHRKEKNTNLKLHSEHLSEIKELNIIISNYQKTLKNIEEKNIKLNNTLALFAIKQNSCKNVEERVNDLLNIQKSISNKIESFLDKSTCKDTLQECQNSAKQLQSIYRENVKILEELNKNYEECFELK